MPMKRILCVAAVLLVVFVLCSCRYGNEPDEAGIFSDGYSIGYDEGWQKGYDAAVDDYHAYDSLDAAGSSHSYGEADTPIWEIVENASWYASGKTGWSAYEAAQIVSLYLENDPSVTQTEFLEAAETLKYFYDYIEDLK